MDDKHTILVVDDDLPIRTLLARFLGRTYAIHQAADGEEAWAIIQSEPTRPDLVITDIRMPRTDGVTLLARVREEYPHIGVVMMSGTDAVTVAVRSMRLGAVDYVVKPFQSLDELAIIVERYFERQSVEHTLAEYVRLHREMTTHLKVRTFLCVDVVGSTRMKAGQDPFLVQFSFAEYHRFVQATVESHHGVVHSTAGDGVMCLFRSAQDAVDAGVALYGDLPEFNQEANRLSTPFMLRGGAHTGAVVIDEAGRVSDMFSSALDITGHLQKEAEPDRFEISRETWDTISNGGDFEPTGKEVDGLAAYGHVPPSATGR
ncbi:hypothetical protein CMK11_13885 [Candidatus Poribacteria bacterium]|nr:hypothetical protein [Candidatus Poribacteria bacterium]